MAFLAALLLGAMPGRAQAQVTISNLTLCDSSGCGIATAGPGAAVYYKFDLGIAGGGGATQATIRDALPAGFIPAGWGCAQSATAATGTNAPTAQPLVFTTNVQPSGWQCVITGTFASGAVTGATNAVEIVDSLGAVLATSTYNNNVNLSAPLPSNLSITKTANVTSVDITSLPQTVTYTITITNTGLADLYLGQLLTLEDSLSLPPLGVVVNATYLSASCALVPVGGGSDCLASAPVFMPSTTVQVASSVPTPFGRWRFPSTGPSSNGLLKAGHKIVLTVVVQLSRVPGVTCIVAPNSDGVRNHAYIVLTLPTVPITTLSDGNAADNSTDVLVGVQTGATQVDPACNVPFQPPSPVLRVTKIQQIPLPSAIVPWTQPFVRYRVTVQNIATTPGLRIRRIQFADWVVQGLETPNFIARRIAHSCSGPCTLNPLPGPVNHQFLGSGDTRLVSRALLVDQVTGGLLPGQSATFTIDVRYSNPGCDSYPAINPKTIFNIGRVTGWTEQVGAVNTVVNQTVQGAAVTRMRPVPACPLTVQKTSTSTGVVLFNNNPNTNATTVYNIVFSNPTNQTFTMGTLGDMMRIRPNPFGVAPYAVQLRVDYAYTCNPIQGMVTGYPAANPNAGNSTTPYDTAQVVVTQLPQQGVRLIRNLQPVVFGPNSKLQCNLFAWVHQPPANDPYCSTGQLENAAVLDASIFYDPNSQWPVTTTPGMWASSVRPLPRCHNLVVNKAASPPWIWPGGPVTWTLRVTNAGPVIVPGDRLIVTDTISGGTATGATTFCLASTSCSPAPNWTPSPTAGNPSVLNIGGLALNSEIRTTINATASAGPGEQVCNAATASVSQWVLPPYTLYYWKNSNTLSTTACIPVFAAGSLTVVKTLTNTVGAQLPANYAFPIGVSCSSVGPNVSIGLVPGATWTAQHVRAGSTCTITEGTLPVLAPTPVCARPVWTTTYSPGSTVVIPQPNNSSTTVTVANAITCARGTLVINKITIGGPVRPNFTTALFNVNCSPGGPVTVVPVAANGQATLGNIPAPATCTLVEQPLPPQGGCNWVGTQAPPGGIAITPGATTTVTITNELVCPTAPSQLGTLIIRKVTPLSAVALNFTTALFNVNCSPGGPVTTVSVPANGQAAVNNIPTPAACTIVEQPLPPLAGCPWVPTQIPPGPVTIAAGATVTVTVVNTRLCGSSAGLVINKHTIVPSGGAAAPASFLFNVACSPGGIGNTIPVPTAGLSQVVPIAGGATCNVGEQPPPAPPGCAWSVTQAPPGSVTTVPGAVAVVNATNNLVCNPSFGTLAIVKTTTVPQGFALPASFLFNVNCGPGGLVTTVSVPANGQTLVPGILAPATCAVAEQAPPPQGAGCSWTVSQVPAGSVAVAPGATVTVTAANQLTCNFANLIVKNITIVPSGMQPPAFFATNPGCGSGGPNSPVSIPANNQFGFLNIPAPLTCTVAEQAPPPPAGCAWTVTQAPTGSVTVASGATVTVTVTNVLTCGQTGDAGLLIRKFVLVNASTEPRNLNIIPWLPHQSFPVTVTCGSNPPIQVALTSANNYQMAVVVPVGATCTVHETPPAFPSGNCTWSVSYPNGASARIATGTIALDVHNEQRCVPVGSITVTLNTIFPPGAPTFASAMVDVSCSPSGPRTAIAVPANGSAVVENILIPATCTLTEQVPASSVPGCGWTAASRTAQPIVLTDSLRYRIVSFDNRWAC